MHYGEKRLWRESDNGNVLQDGECIYANSASMRILTALCSITVSIQHWRWIWMLYRALENAALRF